MSGVHRLLTRRDKRHNSDQNKSTPEYGELGPVFVLEEQKKKTDKEEEKKVKAILSRLQSYGINNITEVNVAYALNVSSAAGNDEEAFRLCLLLEDTYEGLVKSYNPNAKLLGAVNREGVTCYLDALLFAMFARLDSFEAMLYDSLEAPSRKKLAGLLRLWVNLLRTGRLITTDVTKQVQEALSECGWEAAARMQQQDTSEAFTFITGQLELPLLTLKMDMFHTGKDDPDGDHKFVTERLLEVAVIGKPVDGKSVVTLEDCLEHYFNNRVEVKRHLENQRRKSYQSTHSTDKMQDMHIETVEVAEVAESPTPTPVAESPLTLKKGPLEQLRPTAGRKRADSIFSQKRVRVDAEKLKTDEPATDDPERQRKSSVRTEVLMPAWQFFKLLPWYTDNVPTSEAQVAAHFARKRPVLGICLKRYTVSNDGRAERLNTFIDIPLEIAVPDFVSDDSMEEDSPLVGNFKLVLQSVVCHRGNSVHSGHYVSLVRGNAANAVGAGRPSSSSSGEDDPDPWMLFDDLARERVTYVDMQQALKAECPYLLFYQVQPIEDFQSIGMPPSYAEAISRHTSDQIDLPEKMTLPEYTDNETVLVDSNSPSADNGAPTFDAVDFASHSTRTSMDAGTALDDVRGRTSMSSIRRRSSIAFDDSSYAGSTKESGPSAATTPYDDNRTSFLGLPGRRGSRQSKSSIPKTKSRPTSQGPDNSSRFSLGMSKLTNRMSKNDLANWNAAANANAAVAGPPEFSGSEGSVENLPVADQKKVEELTKAKKSDKESHGRKKDKAAAKEHGGHHHLRKKHGQVPDRDCIMM